VNLQDIDNFTLLGEGLDGSPGEMLDKAARTLKVNFDLTYKEQIIRIL